MNKRRVKSTVLQTSKTSQTQSPEMVTSFDSTSLSAFFSPWVKNQAPPIYPNAQTGPKVTVTEFLLFFVAAILLVVTLGLTAMSIWSLFVKSRFKFLDCSTELAYFAFPVAILCLPCSWMSFSVHNDPKSRRFLSIVILLLSFSILVMASAVYVGFTHKLRLKPGQIEDNSVLAEFRKSMLQSMGTYGRGGSGGSVWDEVQARLGCCGVDNHTDWLALNKEIPRSCCYYREVQCVGNATFATGCLKIITGYLASQTCLFSGINCVALFLQCCAFVPVSIVCFCGKRREEE